MSAKILAGLITAALIGYFLLMARQAFAFIGEGGLLTVLGVAILLLPALGSYVVVQEWRFGRRVADLAQHLGRRGELPIDDLPKRPSGRPSREAADARFEDRAADVQGDPGDAGAWFRLAVAYDDAGDRRRGRSAMRRALAVHEQQRVRDRLPPPR